MTSLAGIRATIASALAGIPDLQAYPYTPSQVNPPAAVVAPDAITYDVNLEHDATYQLPVLLIVSLGDWASAQRSLDGFCSHDSAVIQALNAIEDFDVQVLAMSEYGRVDYADKIYLGATLTVEVYA